MATFEDKLMGFKSQNYCSSSEDEDDDQKKSTEKGSPKNYFDKWNGTSANTGPKGVLNDWRRFKQLENEKRKDQEKERIALAKKLALTCRSHLDDEEKKSEEALKDVDSIIGEDLLKEYMEKRMLEMTALTRPQNRTFGVLFHLKSRLEFLDYVDEDKSALAIIHLYDESIEECIKLNECLEIIAKEFSYVKFSYINASTAGLSQRFLDVGLPAVLVYKKGILIGNFVGLIDQVGDDFRTDDIIQFLIQHGFLSEDDRKIELMNSRIDNSQNNETDSD